MNSPASHPARPTAAKSKRINISRRSFLKSCTALAAATGIPLWAAEREIEAAGKKKKILSPNDRPRLALIGCGGMGKNDAGNASNFGDLVAFCDVDETQLASAVAQFGGDGKTPATYSDFRKLLEDDSIDAVINVTPDHWHSLINIAAARARKDIYSEKPLTLTIGEGRHVVKAVRENGVILQTGTQQRSSKGFHLVCELVRNGRLGKLKQADVWLPAGLHDGPFQSTPAPKELNWDYWLGQAPKVDYIKERCHRTFRFWYDYSGGTMTDWGAHHNDIAYWGVGLIAPREVASTRLSEPVAGGYDAYSDYVVNYTYENGVGLNIHTTKDDNIWGAVVNKAGQRNGIRFEGSEGWFWVNRDGFKASDPELLSKPLPENAERLYVSADHWENFIGCLSTRKAPICDVETGHRSATMCHLGAISLRTGLKLNWDYDAEMFVGENAAEGNRYINRAMRRPYDYTFVS